MATIEITGATRAFYERSHNPTGEPKGPQA